MPWSRSSYRCLILGSAWRLLRRSAHILLEGTPEGMDADIVGDTVEREAAGVHDVHHVHIWQLAGGSHVATLHARAQEGYAPDQVILAIQTVLRERFSVAARDRAARDGALRSEPAAADPLDRRGSPARNPCAALAGCYPPRPE